MSNEDSDDEYYTAMLSTSSQKGPLPVHKVILQRGFVTRISDKDFVRSWQRSDSLEELNQILGISNQTHGATVAKQRANDMRKKGVPLKHLRSKS